MNAVFVQVQQVGTRFKGSGGPHGYQRRAFGKTPEEAVLNVASCFVPAARIEKEVFQGTFLVRRSDGKDDCSHCMESFPVAELVSRQFRLFCWKCDRVLHGSTNGERSSIYESTVSIEESKR